MKDWGKHLYFLEPLSVSQMFKGWIMMYLKWITNKILLYSTGNSVQCYVAAWMGGEFWREWIHVYVRLGPFAVHLKLSQHC